MRVLFVLRPDPLAGIDIKRYVENLSVALLGRGIDVYVLVPENEEMFDSSGVRAIKWAGQENIESIRGILREIRPQMVQLENYPHLVRTIRQTFHGPLVLHLHSLSPLSSESIARGELRVALCLVDKVVLGSHFLKSLFVGRYYGLRLRTAVIHPGVDAASFRPVGSDLGLARERTRLRKLWGIAQDELAALFAGPPLPDKGLNVVLKAWPALITHKVRLVVAGYPARDGPWPYLKAFNAAVNAAGEGVVALGQIPHGEMAAVYRAADLFLYPSQGREALGHGNLEAMASGLPIAASLRGGVVEIVDPACALLVRQYADTTTWSRGIIHLATHPELRTAMGRAALERSKRFTWERTAQSFLQLNSEG